MPSPRPSAEWQVANDAAIAAALAADEVVRTTPSPAKNAAEPGRGTATTTTPSAPPLPSGSADAALAASEQAAEDAAGAVAFYDTTATTTTTTATAAPAVTRTTSEDPCASDAALAFALQEAFREQRAAEAAAATAAWTAPALAAAQAGGAAVGMLASAFAGPWHAVCHAATSARLAGQRLASHRPRPLLAAAAADAPAERRRLDATLAAHCLVERVVTGDGACQFRAVADQLYGSEAFHPAVRAAAVARLGAAPSAYAPFVAGGEDYASYVARLARPTEWGDHVTLQALADAYGVRIVVVSSYEQPFIEVTPAAAEAGGGSGDKGGPPPPHGSIFLSFFAEVHYNSVYAAPKVAVDPSPGGGGGGGGVGAAPWTPERARRQVESEQVESGQ